MEDFFKIAIERVLRHEGGYVNNPRDPGGETNFGLTKRFCWNLGWRKPMQALTRENAIDLYKVGIWYKVNADHFHPAIGFQLFDAAVHSGDVQAIIWAQRSCGELDDGIMGPKSSAALRKADPAHSSESILDQREDFLKKLPNAPHFPGWFTRIKENRGYREQDLKRAWPI